MVTLSQCTLAANSATSDYQGGGGGVLNSDFTSITNSIVAGNAISGGQQEAGADIDDESIPGQGGLSFGGANIVQDIFSSGSTGPSPIAADPNLAPLGNYGGPTQTMPPLPGSRAIDAGDDSVTNFLATDQRGSARLVGAHVDIGAVESGGLWVQDTSDSDSTSLRAILANAASITSPKIINFVPSLSGSIINLASQLVVTDPYGVAIDAASLTNGIQISGNTATRVFYVTNGAVTTLNSLTIDYGLAPAGTLASGGGGGGIFCNTGGQAALLNCSIVNNLALAPAPGSYTGFAGAIACYFGHVALTNCTVADNEVFGPAGQGGAFYNYSGTLIFDHCTVANNLAASFNGGVAGGGSTILRATVLANGNIDFQNYAGGISLGNNFIADGTGSELVNGFNGDQILTGGSASDANLALLGNYGGPAQTMPPLPGSPVIDAGGPPDAPTDQRGYPRLLGLATDIGAVEGVLNTRSETLAGAKRLGNGSVQFSFTNITDESFSVLASTSLTNALSTWTPIGSAVENPAGSGHFQFTDPAAANYPQRFYRVTSP